MSRPKVIEVLLRVVLMDVEYGYEPEHIAKHGLSDPMTYARYEIASDLMGDNVVSTEVIGIGGTRVITDNEAEEMGIDLVDYAADQRLLADMRDDDPPPGVPR